MWEAHGLTAAWEIVTEGSTMKKRRKPFIQNKTAIYVLVGALVLFLVMGVVTYYKVSDIMIDQSKQSAMSLAAAIARELDGDELARVHTEDSPAYRNVLWTLNKYHNYAYVRYLYTMR